MISKSKKAKIEREKEKARLKDVERRFLSPNIIARQFCWSNGLTVYATAQVSTNNKVKIFRQRGEAFLPISEKLYDQSDEQEMKEYCAAIDMEYERIYLKMKDKVK